MISKENKLYISKYNDVYGKLLSSKSSDMLRLYYDCDLSLMEIAEQFGVTRQAVRDTLMRAEKQLIGYEDALDLSHWKLTALEIARKALFKAEGGEVVIDDVKELITLLEGNNGSF